MNTGVKLCGVALRKESVDRNPVGMDAGCIAGLSLSARRAWIEIAQTENITDWKQSLSARRAWIEIFFSGRSCFSGMVALRKESVDRNLCGGRVTLLSRTSLSARRAWIEIWSGFRGSS